MCAVPRAPPPRKERPGSRFRNRTRSSTLSSKGVAGRRFDARGGRSEVCGDAIVQWWGLEDERSDVAGRAIGSLHRPLARKADVRRTHGQPLHKSTSAAADWPTKQ